MAVSFGIGSYIEGGVVAGIIVLNIIIGFMQEYSAEKTMDSLRSLSSPTSMVIRGGENMTVPTIQVVPGDFVELKTGGEHCRHLHKRSTALTLCRYCASRRSTDRSNEL